MLWDMLVLVQCLRVGGVRLNIEPPIALATNAQTSGQHRGVGLVCLNYLRTETALAS
jgi:hypothetical protein